MESHKNILFSAGKKSHGGIEGYVLLGQEATAGGPTKGSKVLSMVSAVGQTLMLVNSSIIIWSSYNSNTGVNIMVVLRVPSCGMVGIKHTDILCKWCVICIWDTYGIAR